MLRAIKVAAAVIGVVVAIFFYRVVSDSLARPNVTHDYLADLNDGIVSKPDEMKAWPVFRPLWIQFGVHDDENFSDLERETADQQTVAVKPGDDEWPACVKWLREIEPLLQATREGSKLPYLGLELQSDRSQYSKEDNLALFGKPAQQMVVDDSMKSGLAHGILLPHLTCFYRIVKALEADTRLAIEEKDSQRAASNMITIFGISRHAAESNLTSLSSAGCALQFRGIQLIEDVLRINPQFLSDRQLSEIRIAIKDSERVTKFDLEPMRLCFLDLVQRTYSDDGNGDGKMTHVGADFVAGLIGTDFRDPTGNIILDSFSTPFTLSRFGSRKLVLQNMEELVSVAKTDLKTPFWKQPESGAFRLIVANQNQPGYQLLARWFDYTDLKRSWQERTVTKRDVADAAIAAHLFRRAKGEWPRDWQALLDAGLIQKIPVDLFNGQEMNLKQDRDFGFLIYSVGPNLADDGGEAGRMKFENVETIADATLSLDAAIAGDWVVWPFNRDSADEDGSGVVENE